MSDYFHSVTLDEAKCMGCTNCLKRCPTEAIRIRDGKARIMSSRCIDCGECIRVCPHHAKRVRFDDLSIRDKFAYTIALPPPTLYGQFNNLSDIDYILTGLLEMGFDDVFEVSRSAEIVSDATRKLMKKGALKTPVINSACPAVVRLVMVQFPHLREHVLPLFSPMHVAARQAKLEAAKKTGLSPEQIGVFFISPCPAKITDARQPIGTDSLWVDGAFSMADIYPRLVEHMNKVKNPLPLAQSGIIGVGWANSGGEASALIREKYLAADGIENVMSVLEQMEDERLKELDFIELNACPGGCVGGILAVENAYLAKARIQQLRKYLPVSLNHVEQEDMLYLDWHNELESRNVLGLSDNLAEAMAMMSEIDRLVDTLPSLDCGACGSPSCRTFAADVVKGAARLNDCIFILRQEASSAGIDVSDDPRLQGKPTKEEVK